MSHGKSAGILLYTPETKCSTTVKKKPTNQMVKLMGIFIKGTGKSLWPVSGENPWGIICAARSFCCLPFSPCKMHQSG